jgi:Flp pilus assembly protein TadD
MPDELEAFHLKAEDAIRHARALNPHDGLAYAAEASLLPLRGEWTRREAILREGLKYNRDHDELLLHLADLLHNVGRSTDAAQYAARANAAATQPDPALIWLSTQIYWCAGRLAEADAMAAQGASLFPRQRSCWFTRVYLKMFTGRSDEALAILTNQQSRPPGQPDKDFDAVAAVATALKTRAAADIDAAIAANLGLAHIGAGYAENFVGFAAALGRTDDAFRGADALYFDRGFKVGNLRFSSEQRTYTDFHDRRTRALFYPSSRPMQRDPRFAVLVDQLGLVQYWKDAGAVPDYQKAR